MSIEMIEKDIKRCIEVIGSKDYLELVICIEELRDTYDFFSIDTDTNNVWRYSKSDLVNIKDMLIKAKLDIIKVSIIDDLKTCNLSESDMKNSIIYIDEICDIYGLDVCIQSKWDLLKPYINMSLSLDLDVSKHIIHLVNITLKEKLK